MHRLLFLLVAACAAGAAAPGEVRLTAPGEPGRPLVVTGVLRDADGRPAAGVTFRVYQADADGEYDARDPDDERTARLAADVTTDGQGRFRLRTVLPGAYGQPPGDPHLHVDISAADPWAHSIYFAGFLGESTRTWMETTAQAHLVTLAEQAGGLVGHVEMRVSLTAR